MRFNDRIGNPHDCLQGQVATCDATGDCNFDFTVTFNELITVLQIAQGTLHISACPQGDSSGDGRIMIDEVLEAQGVSLSGDAHNGTLVTAPSFQGNKHLQPGSTGWDAALTPSSAGVPVCRAGSCDLDSHARPADSGYEIGAYEGTGTQGFSSTCQNVAPGQCLAGASALAAQTPVTLEVTSSAQCPDEPARISIALSGSDGTLRGAQFDLVYDPAVFEVDKEKPACTAAMVGYQGDVYTAVVTDPPPPVGLERLRVILFDFAGAKLADGPLAECAFGVRADAAPGAYPLLVEDLMVAGPEGAVDAVASKVEMEVLGDCSGEEAGG